jgi:hypothetical protein
MNGVKLGYTARTGCPHVMDTIPPPTIPMADKIPKFDDLPLDKAGPPLNAWGLSDSPLCICVGRS